MKKLLALAMVLVLCVSTLSLFAFAADTTTVHAYVPADWTAPNVYSWPTGGDGAVAWPGSAMTQEDGQWFTGSIPITDTNVIINCNGAQTADLAFDGGYPEIWVVVGASDGSNATVYYEKPENVDAPQAPSDPGTDAPVEFVAPSSLAIVGTGIPGVGEWDPADPTGDMEMVSDLVWVKEIVCPAGTTMSFKFAGDDAWVDTCNFGSATITIGTAADLACGGDSTDMSLTVDADCTLKFTVDLNPMANGGAATVLVESDGATGETPETPETPDVPSDFVGPNSLAIVGTGIPGVGEWDPADPTGDMEMVSDLVWVKEIVCPAGTTMSFKFAGDDAWVDTCNFGSATITIGTAADLACGGDSTDMSLTVDADCTLKFTVDLNPMAAGGAATVLVETAEGGDAPSDPGVDEPAGDSVIAHARIPESWGTNPCFWAWELASQKNAFDAWPGVVMTQNGEWFEIEIPNWVDSVIVNDGGSTQTADLTIEAGKEVWLDVYAFDNVVITYEEPGAREEPTEPPATEPPATEAPSTEAPETEAPEASENAPTQAPTVKVDTVGRRNRTFLVIALVLVGLVGVGTVISMIPGKNT